MKNINYFLRKNRHKFYFGIIKKFQGFGFMLSFDNPITTKEYLLIEIKFFWLCLWYSFEY